MGDIFLKLLNMSITAGWLIVAIICVRLLLRKMPKWVNCLLWSLVAVRLICPFSMESVFSLQPSAEPIKSSTIVDGQVLHYRPSIDSGLSSVNDAVNPVLMEMFDYSPIQSAAPLQIVTAVAANVWLLGVLALLIFAVVSMWKLHHQVKEAVCYRGNVYLGDAVKSPFVLGVVRPKIYLPSGIGDEEIECIIAHENAHLRRKDHWWKPLGYLLLCVYWFQPLCWVAYVMLCKDIELACDEKVIQDMTLEAKKEYSRVLLSCATQRRLVTVCPLAFGEVGVKERVKSVLNYKKPAFWITVVAIIVSVIVAVCFLTTPAEESAGKTDEAGEGNVGATDTERIDGATEWVTEEVNLEKRDVTHDGVEDYIVTSMTYDPSIIDQNAPMQERIAQQIRYDVVSVKVYDGRENSGTYSEEQLLWSQEYSWVHVGNGQISVVQVEGKDYLLTSNLWAGQGTARWTFEVFSLNATGEKQIIDQQTVEFAVDAEDVTGERAAFREAINQHISDGILIAALDVDLDIEKQFISTAEKQYAPMDYYGSALVKYDALEENETTAKGTVPIDASKIAEIEITNGNTGVRKQLTPKEQYSQEYYNYNDLVKLYRQLGLTSQYEPNSRVGYQYCMWLKDADGNVLQTVTPYKDGLTVDGIFYQYENTDENAAASLRLMEYIEGVFQQDVCGLPKASEWGIQLTAEDVSPSGLTINCTQAGGDPTGELQTGSDYLIEKYVNGKWQKVEYLPQEHQIAWTAEAWMIPMNGSCQWEVNWEWLYGKLPEGRYRIGKGIMDFRGTGDYDTAMHYAEFEIKK